VATFSQQRLRASLSSRSAPISDGDAARAEALRAMRQRRISVELPSGLQASVKKQNCAPYFWCGFFIQGVLIQGVLFVQRIKSR
jgi:putative hemolysin